MLDDIPRYVVEALDRTLGGDWFQVGEASPGDKKVLELIFIHNPLVKIILVRSKTLGSSGFLKIFL